MNNCAIEINSNYSLYISNSTFISNKGDLNNPGAIKSSGIGSTIILNTNFTKNTGISKGGAVYLDVETVEIRYCFFTSNMCSNSQNLNNDESNGGGIFLKYKSGCELIIDSCFFKENEASTSGGSIFIHFYSENEIDFNSKIKITNCQFLSSLANVSGGAIYDFHEKEVDINSTDIENCLFKSCFSTNGGAIFYNDAINKKIIYNCTFENDTAIKEGGGIYAKSNLIDLLESNFAFCQTENEGGAIKFHFAFSQYSFYSKMNTFYNCSSDYGGALNIEYAIFTEILSNNFTNCYSYHDGGAILSTSIINTYDCLYANCCAGIDIDGDGGAIFSISTIWHDIDFIINSTFINCTASSCGGAVFVSTLLYEENYNNYLIKKSNFTNCKSNINGGAISTGYQRNSLHYNNSPIEVVLEKCLFKQCESNYGGAIYTQDGNFITNDETQIFYCLFIDCFSKSGQGYAIFSESLKFTIKYCKFQEFKRSANSNHSILLITMNEYIMPILYSCHFEDNRIPSLLMKIIHDDILIEGFTFNNFSDALTCININQWTCRNTITFENNTFSNIKETHCIYTDDIYFPNSLNINNCHFFNNSIKVESEKYQNISSGSCICINNCHIKYFNVQNCTFNNNTALMNGGSIYMQFGYINEINITNSFFQSCYTTYEINGCGGAIYLSGISRFYTRLLFNTFINCSTSNNGGALFINNNLQSIINVFECNFTKCIANKEGGAIYYEMIENNDDLIMRNYIFSECIFNECISQSGGGSISFSATYFLIIEKCIFISNNAENGKGGALYIHSNFNQTEKKLNDFNFCMINKCNFTCNKGLDGFAIRIEGNNNESQINITENIFINNYNKLTINEGFIISLEICCIFNQQIINENFFLNHENGVKINVNEFSCVERPIITSSQLFTQTVIFTESAAFSKSQIFTQTYLFSKSQIFTQTYLFSKSPIFSETNSFFPTKIKDLIENETFEKSLESESTRKIEESSSINNIQTINSQLNDMTYKSEISYNSYFEIKSSISINEPSINKESFYISIESSNSNSFILEESSSSKRFNIGAILGIIFGIIFLLLTILLIIVLIIKKGKSKNDRSCESVHFPNKPTSIKDEECRSRDEDSDLNFWL